MNMHKRFPVTSALLLVFVFVIAVALGVPFAFAAPVSMAEVTLTPAVSATPSPAALLSATNTPCGFVWTYEETPAYTARLEARLETALLREVAVNTQGYGEIGGQDCEFYLMNYEVDLTIVAPTITSEAALGNLAARVLSLLDNSTGRLRLSLNGNGVALRGDFYYDEIIGLALDQRLRGSALIEALSTIAAA